MTDSIRDAFDDGADALGRELRDEAEKLAKLAEDGMAAASQAVDEAADALNEGVRRTRRQMGAAGRRVSHAIDESTEYVRSRGFRGIVDDVEDFVRENPVASLITVATASFLIGTSMRRRR